MMTNVFELSDRLIEHGITRTQIARTAGRSLGHVCMVLNGQRHMSKYLAEVIADLIEESEREMNIQSCVPYDKGAIPIEAVKGGFLGVWPVPFHLGFSLHCGDGPLIERGPL